MLYRIMTKLQSKIPLLFLNKAELLLLCRKQNAKRERSWSPPSRESTPPARPMSKKDRKIMLKRQGKANREEQNEAQQRRPQWRPSSSSSQGPIQDHNREMARARRFGNGSALGNTRGQVRQVRIA